MRKRKRSREREREVEAERAYVCGGRLAWGIPWKQGWNIKLIHTIWASHLTIWWRTSLLTSSSSHTTLGSSGRELQVWTKFVKYSVYGTIMMCINWWTTWTLIVFHSPSHFHKHIMCVRLRSIIRAYIVGIKNTAWWNKQKGTDCT